MLRKLTEKALRDVLYECATNRFAGDDTFNFDLANQTKRGFIIEKGTRRYRITITETGN